MCELLFTTDRNVRPSGKIKTLLKMDTSSLGMVFCLDSSSGSSSANYSSSFFSSSSSTLTSCFAIPSTASSISNSSSSMSFLSFAGSFNKVSVAFLIASSVLSMILSQSHLVLRPDSSGVVFWYLPTDHNSALHLTQTAKWGVLARLLSGKPNSVVPHELNTMLAISPWCATLPQLLFSKACSWLLRLIWFQDHL